MVEETQKLEDWMLFQGKTWQNLASWSILSSCFWGVAALRKLREPLPTLQRLCRCHIHMNPSVMGTVAQSA